MFWYFILMLSVDVFGTGTMAEIQIGPFSSYEQCIGVRADYVKNFTYVGECRAR